MSITRITIVQRMRETDDEIGLSSDESCSLAHYGFAAARCEQLKLHPWLFEPRMFCMYLSCIDDLTICSLLLLRPGWMDHVLNQKYFAHAWSS